MCFSLQTGDWENDKHYSDSPVTGYFSSLVLLLETKLLAEHQRLCSALSVGRMGQMPKIWHQLPFLKVETVIHSNVCLLLCF